MENTQKQKDMINYLFLIDTEAVIQKVKTEVRTSKDPYNNTMVFHDIFKIIYNHPECKPYWDFFTSENSFNHTKKPDFVSVRGGFYIFMKVILRNHCILHGLNQTLKRRNETPVEISFANDKAVHAGHLRPQTRSDFSYIKYSPQCYYQHKQRLIKHPYYYSCKLIQDISATKEDYPSVPPYAGTWVRFLFTNSIVSYFNRSIGKRSSIKYYENLKREVSKESSELNTEDQVLFKSAMENIYGFSFFQSVSELLRQVYDKNTQPQKGFRFSYHDIEGAVLQNLIEQTAQLPFTYNRYFFLEYAIFSIRSSEILEDDIKTLNKNALFDHVTTSSPSLNQLILDGLSKAEHYLRQLHYIVIPLLENLWDIVMDSLKEEITLESYCNYIRQYSHLLCADFSVLTPEDLKSFYWDNSGFDSKQRTFDANMEKWVKKRKLSDWSISDHPGSVKFNSSYEKNVYIDLLKKYCNTDRLTVQPSDILDLLKKNSTEKQFDYLKKQHSQMLLNFTKSMTPHQTH